MPINISTNNNQQRNRLQEAMVLARMRAQMEDQQYQQRQATSDQQFQEREVVKDRNIRSRISLRDQMARQAETRKPQVAAKVQASKNLNQYSSDANQMLVAINKLEKGAKTLGDFPRGFAGQLGSRARVSVQKFGKEKNLTRYLGVLAQEFIPMARKVMEEKGPITEFDVKRVEKGLGDVTTPLEDKLFLLGEIRNKVRKALVLKRQLAQGGGEESFEALLNDGSQTQDRDQNDDPLGLFL